MGEKRTTDAQNDYEKYRSHVYDRLRRVIALSRIVMRDVNIAVSEHSMLFNPDGVADLLNAGANVVKMFSGPLWTRQFNLVGSEERIHAVLRRDAAAVLGGRCAEA